MARRNRKKFYDSSRVIKIKTMRNVFIALIISVFLFAVYRFNFTSKSEVTETVKINFKEIGSELLIGDQEIDVEVKEDESGDKYIVLPEKINGYYSESYNIIKTTISNPEDVENPEDGGNSGTVANTLDLVTNDNIGDYINLGNNVIGTENQTDDWRILYKDGDIVYAILADYLPASQVPVGVGLITANTSAEDEYVIEEYPYSVWSNTDRNTLLNGLKNEAAWSTFTNGINGATATGAPTAELLMRSYNTKNRTELVYTDVPTLDSSTEDYNLYVPQTEAENHCHGYWLASSHVDESTLMWNVYYRDRVDNDYYYSNYNAARPVVALPTNTQAELVDGVWTVTSTINTRARVATINDTEDVENSGTTTNTLALVTNNNIGDYINLGNNVIGTENQTDDWRILYKDGQTVYAILADYLPSSQVPVSVGLITANTSGEDEYVIEDYPYSVWSNTDRNTLLNGLKNEAAWSAFTNGINGATATGSPTAELLMNSYNTKNGTNLVYTDGPTLDSSTEDYNLYVPQTETENRCHGYWLASSYANDFDCMWNVYNPNYVDYDYYDSNYNAVRPVVALPTNTKVELVDGVWVVRETEIEETTLQPGAQHYVEVGEDGNIVLDNITVEVTYQSLVSNETTLYKQDIEFRDDTTKITATGFIPFGYTIAATESDTEVLEATMAEYEDLQGVDLLWGYNIGIIKDDTQYQPKDYGQSIKIKILTTKANELRTKINLKVLHFTDSGIEQFSEIEKAPNSVTFTTESFSDFAIVVDSEFTESRIIFNKYEEDYKYYMGRNYTDPLAAKTITDIEDMVPKFTDDNLAKVTVNYYGTPYETYENTGTETVSKTTRKILDTSAEQTIEMTTNRYLGNPANNNTTKVRTYQVECYLEEVDYQRLDKTKGWSATFTMDFPVESYYLQNTSPSGNTFNSFVSDGNTITITDTDYSAWKENCLVIRFNVAKEPKVTVVNEVETTTLEYPTATDILKSTTLQTMTCNITATFKDYEEMVADYTYITSFTNQDSGYVSDTERQNLFTYINCLPIENGQVTIELIDNPYMDRPWETTRYYDQNGNLVEELTERNGMGFDGWASKEGLVSTLNANTKVQYLTVPVDENKEVNIDLYAHWKKANVVYMKYMGPWDGSSIDKPTSTWSKAITTLNKNIKTATNASSRELNIIVVTGTSYITYYELNSSGSYVSTNTLFKKANAGYTVTSLYNGHNYKKDGAYIVFPNANVAINNDLQIDFIEISCDDTSSYRTCHDGGQYRTTGMLQGNGNNLRIGRGCYPKTDSTTKKTLSTVLGGGANNKEFRTVVESGKYQMVQLELNNVNQERCSTGTLIAGADYDNYTEQNTNLSIFHRLQASGNMKKSSSYISGKPFTTLIVKAGTIGTESFKVTNQVASCYTGIYVAGDNSSANMTTSTGTADRVLYVEGGKIAHINGGIAHFTKDSSKTFIYVKSKKCSVQQIFGGARKN